MRLSVLLGFSLFVGSRAQEVPQVMQDEGCVWNGDAVQCPPNADLHGAILNNATLHNAYIERAELNHAELNYANLQGAYIERAELIYAELYSR